MKKHHLLLALLLVAAFSLYADDPPVDQDYDLWYPGTVLRDGVTATIHCRVFVNEARPDTNASVVAIHGAAHTAATWKNFAEALFAHGVDTQPVSRLIAIDLPGHGQSGRPNGLLFGDITLEDNVNVVIQTIDNINDAKFKPNIIVAHSMGTMVAQKTQATLVGQGTNFKKRFNIDSVILLAPTVPEGLPYFIMESGAGAELLGRYVAWDIDLGVHLYFPDPDWAFLFFTPDFINVVPGTPNPGDLQQLGYNAPESSAYAIQIAGNPFASPPIPRPHIDYGVFGRENKTDIIVVGFEKDILLLRQEGETLYNYLTGADRTDYSKFVFMPGPYAVHDCYITDPGGVVEAIF